MENRITPFSNYKILFYILFVSVFLNFQNSFSQISFWKLQPKKNIKPPEVGSLLVDISYDNVDLSTGTVKPNIPLFSIGDQDLFDQIGLDYVSGSGIKVNSYASDIGLGWDLNIGGYIIREVRGIPDDALIWPDGLPDYVEGGLLPDLKTINGQNLLNGWLDYANWGGIIRMGSSGPNNPYTFGVPIEPINTNTVGNELNNFFEKFSNGAINYIRRRPSLYPTLGQDLSDIHGAGAFLDLVMDGQPDIFYYKCPGGSSGKFIFDENGIPTPIPYNPNIKISPPIGPQANNENQWIITIENGTKFYFPHNGNYYEKTSTETSNFPIIDQSDTPNSNEGMHMSEHISKWYIQKAESVTGHKLEYSYINEPNFETENTISVQQDFHVPGRADGSDGIRTTPPSNFYTGYGSTTQRTISRDTKEVISLKKRLRRINCSNGSEIYMDYSNGINRLDVKNLTKSLGSITLKNMNGKDIMTYFFNQSFFNTPSINDYKGKRLKLEGMNRRGSESDIHQDFYKFEYHESIALPERNSNQQDFWGYFNANPANSLIPAIDNLEDGHIRELSGADRSPNALRAKTAMLKKITYPTGGSIEYNYELNDFKSSSVSYIADSKRVPTGGLRIKSITQKEIGNNQIIKNYIYRLPGSPDISSGQIPVHLRKWRRNGAGRLFEINKLYNAPEPYTALYITRYSYLKYLQATDLIRYSHVTVDLDGNGKTEHRISAFDDYPDVEKKRIFWQPSKIYSWSIGEQPDPDEIYPSTDFTEYQESSSIPGWRYPTPPILLTDKSYLRGMILNIKEYKENSTTPVTEIINTYAVNPDGFNARKIYCMDSNSADDFFAESNVAFSLNFDFSSHHVDLVFLEKTQVKLYNENTELTTTSREYSYNNEFNVVKEEKLIDSDLSELITQNLYPFDSQIRAMPYMSELLSQNRNTAIIVEKRYKDDVLLSKKQINYDQYSLENGKISVIPISQFQSKGNNPLTEEYVILRRDEKANITEHRTKDGIHHINIWGYNESLIIARITNATYEGMPNSVLSLINQIKQDSDYESTRVKENNLRNSLNNLRNNPYFKKAMVTTYTHDPLIGITSMTDPKGYTQYYTYDSQNRLQTISDARGHILDQFRYDYKENATDSPNFEVLLSRTSVSRTATTHSIKINASILGGSGDYEIQWYVDGRPVGSLDLNRLDAFLSCGGVPKTFRCVVTDRYSQRTVSASRTDRYSRTCPSGSGGGNGGGNGDTDENGEDENGNQH